MNRSGLILVIIAVFMLNDVNAQDNLLNAQNPDSIGKLSARQRMSDNLKDSSFTVSAVAISASEASSFLSIKV